ncbi:hypothetical protein N8Z63_07580 [Octadecabacter sp.]|nr:hypothetical protein [Octadecabacter sp.]MDC1229536.1 hypothetical protein [Octadecabacter sp.]
MEQQHQTDVARLVPHETFGPDVRALSPYALADDDMDYGDVICLGLQEYPAISNGWTMITNQVSLTALKFGCVAS